MNREERRKLKKLAKRDSKKLNKTPEDIEEKLKEMEEIIGLQGKPIEVIREFVEKFNNKYDFKFTIEQKEHISNHIQQYGNLPNIEQLPNPEISEEEKEVMKRLEEEELKVNMDLPVFVLPQKLSNIFIKWYNSEIHYKNALPKNSITEGYIISKLDYLLKVEEDLRENIKEQFTERQKDLIKKGIHIRDAREVVDKLLEEWSDIKIYYHITNDSSLELVFYGKNNQELGSCKSYGGNKEDSKIKSRSDEELMASGEIKRPSMITSDFNYDLPMEEFLSKVMELLFGLTICTLWHLSLNKPKKLESKSISGKVSNTIYNGIKNNQVFDLDVNQVTLEKLNTMLKEQN